jgi:hypothetical protein
MSRHTSTTFAVAMAGLSERPVLLNLGPVNDCGGPELGHGPSPAGFESRRQRRSFRGAA